MRILDRIEKNHPLQTLSTMGVGGKAAFYLAVTTIEEMKQAFCFANIHEIPFFIVGNGSNCLFDDRGYAGLIIHNKIHFFEQKNQLLQVGSGTSFSWLGTTCCRHNLSGLEFATGVPGTVGGAIFMNAGAHGQEVSQVIQEVLFLTNKGKEERWPASQITFAYRSSTFQQKKGAIVSGFFSLTPSLDAQKREKEFLMCRKKTQPLDKKSAGSIFRNPKECSAGALIERIGLKGKQIGGAKISEIHGNFIVNEGNATCKDILDLIALIQEEIVKKFGIFLQPEVSYLPYGE